MNFSNRPADERGFLSGLIGLGGKILGTVIPGRDPIERTFGRFGSPRPQLQNQIRPMRQQLQRQRVPTGQPRFQRQIQRRRGVTIGDFTIGGRETIQEFGPPIPPEQDVQRQLAQQGLDADGNRCPQCCKGERLNKSTYFLKDGTRVPARSRCVKIRRRDNLNGRAALNATRRTVGYSKAQAKIQKAIRAAARVGRC